MKKMILVGKTGSGKTSLVQGLQGREVSYRKTQAINFCGALIDTPGEFLENRRLHSALLTTSANCDIVGLVQDATVANSIYPPHFASMFNKRVIGIITKVDKENGDLARAERFLQRAGVEEIVKTSATEGIGLEALKAFVV